MIRLADSSSKQVVWNMWKTVFGDPDSYMNLYFRDKYKPENTLVYFEDEKPVASLQMLKFRFTFYGREIPIYYLSGVCTLPEARRKGYMDLLLKSSFEIAQDRRIPLMILVPQEEWLLGFYNKYDFSQTFDSCNQPLISLRGLNEKYPHDLLSAYKEFDSQYRNQDMTVQKSFDDFKTIMEENALWDYPSKNSLIGMARVIDAYELLSVYAGRNINRNMKIEIYGDDILKANNGLYNITDGDIKRVDGDADVAFSFDIRDLAQVLLGYNTSLRGKNVESLFPEKKPQIHFMLE